MVGLGETEDELFQTFQDLRNSGVTLLSVGQYLSPGPEHAPVRRFVTPEEFERYRREALNMGFIGCAAGPFVRSSYRASELRKTGRRTLIRINWCSLNRYSEPSGRNPYGL